MTLLATACGTATTEAAILANAPDNRPNIVLVLVDDMRADELAYLADTRSLMAEGGTTFRRNIAPAPLCCPTRAELVSGQYGQNNGVRYNEGPYGGFKALAEREDTVPVWLQDSGYRTGYIGKFLNGYGGAATTEPEPGWDVWRPFVNGTAGYYDRWEFYGDAAPSTGYVTTAVEEETSATLERLSAGVDPFFLFVNHTAPHLAKTDHGQELPVAEPQYADYPVDEADLRWLDNPAFNEADVSDLPKHLQKPLRDRAATIELAKARIRALQSVDDAMQRLFDDLRSSGELDNTWVFFTSDNGYQFGEHRLERKNWLFRESLDVPLLVRGPGERPAPKLGTTTSLLDLPATFLDLANAAARRPLDGVSLVPVLNGADVKWRDTVLVQTGRTGTRGVQPGWQFRGVQTSRYLYAANVATQPRTGDYLFDRKRDPHELVNVAYDPRYRKVVRELDRRRKILEDCAGEACNQRFGRLPEPLTAAEAARR